MDPLTEQSLQAEIDRELRLVDSAIAMVRRSDPVPRPPAALTDDEFKFTLPVDFSEPR